MSFNIFSSDIYFFVPCAENELPNKARDVWAAPEEFVRGLSKVKENLKVSGGSKTIDLKDYIRALPRRVMLPKRFRAQYPSLRWSVCAIRYIRNAKKAPVGVVVVDKHGYVGVSMLNAHKGDQWDAVVGIRKALYRTERKRTIRACIEEFRGLADTGSCSPAFRESAGAVLRVLLSVNDRQMDAIVLANTHPVGFVDMVAADKPVATPQGIPVVGDASSKPVGRGTNE